MGGSRHRQTEPFGTDRGLVLRMILVTVATAVLWIAYAGGLVLWPILNPGIGNVYVVLALLLPVPLWIGRRVRPSPIERVPLYWRTRGVLERLAAVAGLATPGLVVEDLDMPLSWTEVRPGRGARVHITRGLIEAASSHELEAVIAHELSHLANRDAWLMAVLAGPPMAIWRGVVVSATQFDRRRGSTRLRQQFAFWFLMIAGPYALGAIPLLLLARMLSRYREFAADRGAAVLTGSPSAVAVALMNFSGALAATPRTDLRAATANDMLHFLPARAREPRWLGRLWATHPPVQARLEHLARLEAGIQARRA